jgi:hypothetical protein
MNPLPSFVLAINTGSSANSSGFISPDGSLSRLMTDVTHRVINIMCTSRAKNGLWHIAHAWSQYWGRAIDCGGAVEGFQLLLQTANLTCENWPLLFVDWTLRPEDGAIFYPRAQSESYGSSPCFDIRFDCISFNGVVSYSLSFLCWIHAEERLKSIAASPSTCTRHRTTQSGTVCPYA